MSYLQVACMALLVIVCVLAFCWSMERINVEISKEEANRLVGFIDQHNHRIEKNCESRRIVMSCGRASRLCNDCPKRYRVSMSKEQTP